MGAFNYTNKFFDQASSVIREVYFDFDTETLLVVLHNGTRAAYTGVNRQTFLDFRNADSSGRYWNNHIKNHFPGISSDGFDGFNQRSFVGSAPGPQAAGNKTDYDVVVEVSGKTTQPIAANDLEDAIREVKDRFAAFGLTVKVVSVSERTNN